MPNVRGQQARIQDDGGCRDQIVGVIDATVAAPEAMRERPGG